MSGRPTDAWRDAALTTLQEGRTMWFHYAPRLWQILDLTEQLALTSDEVLVIPGGSRMLGLRVVNPQSSVPPSGEAMPEEKT